MYRSNAATESWKDKPIADTSKNDEASVRFGELVSSLESKSSINDQGNLDYFPSVQEFEDSSPFSV